MIINIPDILLYFFGGVIITVIIFLTVGWYYSEPLPDDYDGLFDENNETTDYDENNLKPNKLTDDDVDKIIEILKKEKP